MAIFTIVSPIDLINMKEFQVATATDAYVKQGGWVTETADNTVGTQGSTPSNKTLYIVYTSTNSQSRSAFEQAQGKGQVTVFFGGTVEVETDNIAEIATLSSIDVGNKVYAIANGVIACTGSTGVAIGYVTKVGTASVTIKFTL
jgi:hypothetical protein